MLSMFFKFIVWLLKVLLDGSKSKDEQKLEKEEDRKTKGSYEKLAHKGFLIKLAALLFRGLGKYISQDCPQGLVTF